MPILTFLDYQQQVARFTKLDTGNAEFLNLIKDCINNAIQDIASMNNWPQLLVYNSPLSTTLVAAGAVQTLPADFMRMDRFFYKEGNLNRTWRLFERQGMVPPARVLGLPRVYVLTAGTMPGQQTGVVVEPWDQITAQGGNQSMYFNYYKFPLRLVADTDKPESQEWDQDIIRRAIELIFIQHNKLDQAAASHKANQFNLKAAAQSQQSES